VAVVDTSQVQSTLYPVTKLLCSLVVKMVSTAVALAELVADPTSMEVPVVVLLTSESVEIHSLTASQWRLAVAALDVEAVAQIKRAVLAVSPAVKVDLAVASNQMMEQFPTVETLPQEVPAIAALHQVVAAVLVATEVVPVADIQ
jgi:hypothetical protein